MIERSMLARLRSGEGLRDLPATASEGALNLFQVALAQHFAGKRAPDRKDAAFDRLPGEDVTLLVNTEMADRREIQVHPRGQADATAGQACRRRGVVEDLTELLAFSIDVARDVVIAVVL